MSNEVLNTIKARRAVRAYKPDAVPTQLLDAVLEAGTYAPTGGGHQSPVIIAVTSDKYRKEIAQLNAGVMGSTNDPYYGAPVIVLVLADGTASTFVEDESCVLENMMLAAASRSDILQLHRVKRRSERMITSFRCDWRKRLWVKKQSTLFWREP